MATLVVGALVAVPGGGEGGEGSRSEGVVVGDAHAAVE
jgi:hypothetical protein